MREALDFVGFQNVNLLVQAYLPHKERVYKIYGLGQWFRAPVRRSIPDALMRSKDAVMFDSQKKFEPEQFSQYDESECLLDMNMMEKFFKIFSQEFDLLFYGVDIIVDSETGVHYFVDCNYLANYANIPQPELLAAFDSLIVEQIAEQEGNGPKTPRGEHSSNYHIKGRELTPRNVETIAMATVGTIVLGVVCSIAFMAMRRGKE